MAGRWFTSLVVDAVPTAGELDAAGSRYLNASGTDLLGLARDARTKESVAAGMRRFGSSMPAQSKPVVAAQEIIASLMGVERVILVEGPHQALAALAHLGDAWAQPGVPLTQARRFSEAESLATSSPGVLFAEAVRASTGALCAGPRLVERVSRSRGTLVLYEPLGFGVLGEHGAGVASHFGLSGSVVTVARLQSVGYDSWVVAGPASRLDGVEAPPTLSAAAISALTKSIELSRAEGQRRSRVFELAEQLIDALHTMQLDSGPTVTPWVPVWLGEEALAKQWLMLLADQQIAAQAWLEPGKSRLVFSLAATTTDQQLEQLIDACRLCLARLGGATKEPLPPEAVLARPGTFAISNLALPRWLEASVVAQAPTLGGQAPMGIRDRVADAVETLTWRIANDRPPTADVVRRLFEKVRRRRDS
jgi:7-keto-8-aminopelargonate synthetase-like enzyme